MKPSKDQSAEHEPHLQSAKKTTVDPMIDPPAGLDRQPPTFDIQSDEDVDHSVWDEPGVSGLVGKPEKNALTYANWLTQKIAGWSQEKAWIVTLAIALVSGPLAFLAFWIGSYRANAYNFLLICAFVPLAQEIFKIALPLWVVEKRPYYFTGWFQIFVCSLASATIFVTIFNLTSHFFFPPETEIGLIFSWTIFLLMHLVCSTLAATGLERVWHSTMSTRKPPKLDTGYRWFMAAFLVHAVYATCFYLFQVMGGEL